MGLRFFFFWRDCTRQLVLYRKKVFLLFLFFRPIVVYSFLYIYIDTLTQAGGGAELMPGAS